MKTLLIAALVSLSLIVPSFAAEDKPKEPITREETFKSLAKELASFVYLLESFGEEVEKELERKRKEAVKSKRETHEGI